MVFFSAGSYRHKLSGGSPSEQDRDPSKSWRERSGSGSSPPEEASAAGVGHITARYNQRRRHRGHRRAVHWTFIGREITCPSLRRRCRQQVWCAAAAPTPLGSVLASDSLATLWSSLLLLSWPSRTTPLSSLPGALSFYAVDHRLFWRSLSL